MKIPMAVWLLVAWLLVALPGAVRAHNACAGVERASDSKGVQASEKSAIKTPDKPDRPEKPSTSDASEPEGPKAAKPSGDRDRDDSSDSEDEDEDEDEDDDANRGGGTDSKSAGKKGKKTVLSGGQGGGSGTIAPPKPASVKASGKKDFLICPRTGKKINLGKNDPGATANGGQGSDSAVSSGGTGPGENSRDGGKGGPVTTADANGGKTVTGDVKIKDATITYSGGKAIDGNTGMTTNEGSSTIKGEVEIRDGVVRVEPNGTIVIVSGTLIGKDVTTSGGTQSPLDAVGDVVVDAGVDNPQVNAIYSDGPLQ